MLSYSIKSYLRKFISFLFTIILVIIFAFEFILFFVWELGLLIFGVVMVMLLPVISIFSDFRKISWLESIMKVIESLFDHNQDIGIFFKYVYKPIYVFETKVLNLFEYKKLIIEKMQNDLEIIEVEDFVKWMEEQRIDFYFINEESNIVYNYVPMFDHSEFDILEVFNPWSKRFAIMIENKVSRDFVKLKWCT